MDSFQAASAGNFVHAVNCQAIQNMSAGQAAAEKAKTKMHGPQKSGNLVVKVIEARGVRNADLIGKSDCYCIIEVGKKKQKTSTKSNTLDPSWNEEFTFDVKKAKGIAFILKDFDRITKDDDLGFALLPFSSLRPNIWQDRWLDLDQKGSVHVSAQFMCLCGTLSVGVLGARELKVGDLNGSSDPYAEVTVGDSKQKTNTIMKTLNPTWNETFVFNVNGDAKIKVKVQDYDKLKKDDFLGKVSIGTDKFASGLCDEWFNLSTVGSIHLRIRFRSSERERPHH